MSLVIKAILSLSILAVSLPSFRAHAEEAYPCVEAFRKAKIEYFNRLEEVERAKRGMKWKGTMVGLGVGACAFGGMKLAVCSAVALGGALVVGGHTAVVVMAKGNAEYQQLEDAARLYLIYQDFKSGNELGSASKEFVQELGVDVQKEEAVLSSLASKMETGTLCKKDRAAKMVDVVAELRSDEKLRL
jgi:hypothetical protein